MEYTKLYNYQVSNKIRIRLAHKSSSEFSFFSEARRTFEKVQKVQAAGSTLTCYVSENRRHFEALTRTSPMLFVSGSLFPCEPLFSQLLSISKGTEKLLLDFLKFLGCPFVLRQLQKKKTKKKTHSRQTNNLLSSEYLFTSISSDSRMIPAKLADVLISYF